MIVFEGVVEEGRKLGRKLGFPTANVSIPHGLNIKSGVYRAIVSLKDLPQPNKVSSYWAATNIGTNPTIGATNFRSESYILDFEGDIYGKTLQVELKELLREEEKFESIEQLTKQIIKDVEQVRRLIEEDSKCQ